MKIITFKVEPSLITVHVEHSSSDIKVDIILLDGTVLENIPGSTTPIGTTTDVYEFTSTSSHEYDDGIFEAVASDISGSSVAKAVAGNLNKGYQCQLTKALNEDYDCLLLQDMEATKQFVLLSKGVPARGLYNRVLDKCSSCTYESTTELAGISIWLVDGNFIIT